MKGYEITKAVLKCFPPDSWTRWLRIFICTRSLLLINKQKSCILQQFIEMLNSNLYRRFFMDQNLISGLIKWYYWIPYLHCYILRTWREGQTPLIFRGYTSSAIDIKSLFLIKITAFLRHLLDLLEFRSMLMQAILSCLGLIRPSCRVKRVSIAQTSHYATSWSKTRLLYLFAY